MMWLFAVLIVLVMGAIAAVASGRGGAMDAAWTDRPDLVLPADGPVSAADLRRVRFPLAVRGYRMSDVDALLSRVATEMEGSHPELQPQAESRPQSQPESQPEEIPERRREGASDAPETD